MSGEGGPAGWRRSRVLRLLPVLAIAAGAVWFFSAGPQATTLSVPLDGRRDGLQGLTVELYRQPAGTLAHHWEFFYSPANPPPPSQTRAAKIARGEYRAEVVLRYGQRADRVERTFRFDGEDWVEIRL